MKRAQRRLREVLKYDAQRTKAKPPPPLPPLPAAAPAPPPRRRPGPGLLTGSAQARREPSDLLELPPMRAVLKLATPTTLVMFLGTATNVLYTFYVSRLGADAIAAVSLVFPISLLATTAMTGGLGGGAASGIARAIGAGHRERAAEVAEHAIALAVFAGLALAAVMFAGGPFVFALMGGTGAVRDAAATFARIVFGGAVVTFAGAMLDSVLRGEGNVRVPAVWSSVSLGLQIVLTPLCMFSAGLSLPGAAVAVIVSQAIALVPRAPYVFSEGSLLKPRPWPRPLFAWSRCARCSASACPPRSRRSSTTRG